MRNIAVVLAGGSGQRMGMRMPKQFMALVGRTVIEHAVDIFNAHSAIDGVGIVVHPDWRSTLDSILQRNHWDKLLGIANGGAERYLSSLAAIEAFGGNDECNLLLHDAARPLIDSDTVSRVTEALVCHPAVAVAIPSVDTVFQVDDGKVQAIPQRTTMWLAQTPQAFRCSLLRDAYKRALSDASFAATDDCGVVHRYRPDIDIYVVKGDSRNFKITFPEDIQRAEMVIQRHHA